MSGKEEEEVKQQQGLLLRLPVEGGMWRLLNTLLHGWMVKGKATGTASSEVCAPHVFFVCPVFSPSPALQ